MKLLVVDGTNLLFQMFFGMPARITGKDGRLIHGTLGFVGALIKMLKLSGPTHAVVLFDGEHDNPRAELSAEYKANRPVMTDVPEEENPFSQLPDIYDALDCMGISHCEIDIHEADDAAAAYALTYSSETEIIIASMDSDFFQLIGKNVSVLRYRGDKTAMLDGALIQDKLGILPEQYADFKSLTGDNSDNIKGADKIGPKTAAALLRQFGNLETLIERADEIEKPSIRESVKQNAERLRNNYRLIKLDDRATLPYALDKLEYTYDGIKTGEVLGRIGLK
ncbi:MAG: flap endonuclease [Oscillospiraceae bacterium]|jgi:DNA polymerase-1|nr:flap endonuclease [Oscillospiraceae bacterium]